MTILLRLLGYETTLSNLMAMHTRSAAVQFSIAVMTTSVTTDSATSEDAEGNQEK